jgi:hypothetical protein
MLTRHKELPLTNDMESHTPHPYDFAFAQELEAIQPGLARNLNLVESWPEAIGEQVITAILRRGCQSQNTRNITLGRDAALELPRAWLLARIERVAQQTLNLDDEWEYRRLLEMCEPLDKELFHRLVKRGLDSANAEIREAMTDHMVPVERTAS